MLLHQLMNCRSGLWVGNSWLYGAMYEVWKHEHIQHLTNTNYEGKVPWEAESGGVVSTLWQD
jgi:hypothetical protein